MTAAELHVVEDGPVDCPPLLMGSSLGTTTAMWEPQVAALAERHRVLRFDHRGHGGSPVPEPPYEIADLGRDVLAAMDRRGVARADYCGLSIGGMVGMWLGIHAPDRIGKLVLVCTAAHLPLAAWGERQEKVLAAGSTEPIADAVVTNWLTPDFAAAHPDVRAKLREMLTASDPVGYAGCCGAIERMDLLGDLPSISAPTLVISAADDPSTPPEHQEKIAAAIPGARLETVAPAAHLANWERPAEVSALILDHLGPV